MFFHIDIRGDGLPPRTVCLTYDDGPGATTGDGPGPRTGELGAYLGSRGIPATFFVIGRHAERHPDLLGRLRDWGHLIGNHTYSHPGLVRLAATGGDVSDEIARTDEIIAPYVDTELRFLRAPYGNWRETEESEGASRDKPLSIVARALNRSGRFRHYVGPINWDISGQDYGFWSQGRPAEECAQRYLDRIHQRDRGIILMHDSSEDQATRAGNRADEVTKQVVPVLEAEGYRFVRLDAIPQVRSAMAVSSAIALRTGDGRLLGWSDEPRGQVVAEAHCVGAREQFGVVVLDADRMALRATNGFYLAASSGAETAIFAGAATLDAALIFRRPEPGDRRIMLVGDGRAMACGPGGTVRWLPASAGASQTAQFTMQDLFA
jgi:peptidoglycan/xylan/chitin deacetylase (PgdA/CDA1 family)